MKIQDILNLLKEFEKLITNILGQEPAWLSFTFKIISLIIIILLAIWGLLYVLSEIKKKWTENFLPLFYNQEERRRTVKRQRFAKHIENEIQKLNNREEWKDYRFTELEAEVEAEGRRKGFSILPFFQPTQRGLRREKSLSKALELSSERLILVEGEPGSGIKCCAAARYRENGLSC
ncbi:hypothetical protein [Gloeothece verrucosa]|uniref:Uncharacterized protein n=1 Tax=Gloeothece verrucosa (strain PCC 7822) TaxID=497965 RepID=E0U7G6_GLOV7|nr:hypothetical protein [Gloeothece verrucosa]ADN13662.1 hypothetical protein Cyan7822_1672 [Gloeothece verrucosa PCC 7822]